MPPAVLAALTATAWCVLHSLLVDAWRGRRWGRLLYNVFATATLVGLMAYLRSLSADPLWSWHGPWQFLRLALAVAGLALGAWGARAHDGRAFLGLRRPSTDRPDLSRAGVLGHVRHPWYAAGILLLPIWPTTFTSVNVAWRTVFVLYLWVGARIEDRRLERVFGQEFRRYRREVPGFIPHFGIRRRD